LAETPIVRVAVDTPLRRTFDYLAGGAVPQPGARVRVPFGRRQLVGIVLELGADSGVPRGKLKSIGSVLDAEPVLDAELLALLRWAAEYYHHPIGEVLFAALPKLAREGARCTRGARRCGLRPRTARQPSRRMPCGGRRASERYWPRSCRATASTPARSRR